MKPQAPEPPADPLIRAFAALIARPWTVLLVAIALAGLGLAAASQMPFLTARSAMLPADLPEAKRFEAFLHDFGAASDLVVVIEATPETDGAALDAFAEALVTRLGQTPGVGSALRGVPTAFFAKVAWAVAPRTALDTLGEWAPAWLASAGSPPAALTDAFRQGTALLGETELGLPSDFERLTLGIAAATAAVAEVRRWLEAPAIPTALDLVPMARIVGAERVVDGAFRSHDGRLAFIFVRARDASEDFSVVGPFVDAVREAAQRLRIERHQAGLPVPTVGLTGLPAVVAEEFVAVRADIALVVASAAGLILLLVLVGLRSWRRALVVFVPMGLGVCWNLGLTVPLIGHLTILTSSFTAILFGLGVDYGISLSAQVLQTPGPGAWPQQVAAGARAALRPLAVAGGATALVFAALVPSDFPGFAELGIMAAMGVVVVWLATVLVQPALLALLPLAPKAVATSPELPVPVSRPVKPLRWTRSVTLAALVVAGAGGWALTKISFDYDVLSLLPRDSEAARLQRRMVAESDFQAEAMVLTAPDIAAARVLADRAEGLSSLASVQRIDAFFPEDAEARAAIARHLGHALRDSALLAGLRRFEVQVDTETLAALDGLLAALSVAVAEGQELAFGAGRTQLVTALEPLNTELKALRLALARPEAAVRVAALADTVLRLLRTGGEAVAGWIVASPLQPIDLPSALRDRFFSASGSVAVYGFPARSVYAPEALDALLDEVYAIAPEATGFPTTHRAFSAVVVRAFAEGTALAAALALLWMIVTLRNAAAIAVGALPLVVGGGGMLLALWALGFRFNFANIVALPLVMGLALDYGVWFAHQRLDHPALSAAAVARMTWRPILLAAATTLAGLGAITLARYQGVASMGLSLTVGLLSCLAAALWVAPRAAEWWSPARPLAGSETGQRKKNHD